MKTTIGWKGQIVAIVAALMLAGTGIALAKPHGGKGRHGDAKGKGKGKGTGGGGPHGKGDKPDGGGGSCEAAAMDAVLSIVDAACPCAGRPDGAGGMVAWKNRGEYVRCVTHMLRDGVRAAGIKRRCLRGIVPCAARSACGRRGALACVVTTSGTCMNSTCSNDSETACMLDADCVDRTCSVTTGDRCTALGGVAASGSCCTGSPSGAFLE